MRVVFMGTPSFAVPSLQALASRHVVIEVYTRPDAASGRGGRPRPSAVKQVALALGVPVRQPATLRDETEHRHLAELEPDVICVAAYGLILPREVLAIPSHGCLNVHASLLPRWRGAAPVQRAILAGDEVTGVSIMRMAEGLDTGPFCEVVEVPIAEKGAEDLTAELAERGAEALVRAIERIERGDCVWVEQDEARTTYAPKVSKEDVALSPELSVDEALRRVRASNDHAPSRITVSDRSATVIEASVAPPAEPLESGDVAVTKRALLLGMRGGAMSADRVKPDGKREMPGGDWARGARFADSATWESAS